MTEGCEFRDLYPQFQALNVEIVGVSFDHPTENKAFANVNNFQYDLLSDQEHVMTKYYGAYSNPIFANRETVILDPTGRWVLTYPTVGNTKQHPNDVLADLIAIVGANP